MVSVGDECAQCGQVQGDADALADLIVDYLRARDYGQDAIEHEALERLTRAVHYTA
jgi:hypothetical protein